MPERAHGYFCIVLYINILHNVNTGIVNNFSTTFGNKQGFRAQPRKKDRTNQNRTSQRKEECRKEQKDRSSLLDAMRPGVASLLGELLNTRVRLNAERETRKARIVISSIFESWLSCTGNLAAAMPLFRSSFGFKILSPK